MKNYNIILLVCFLSVLSINSAMSLDFGFSGSVALESRYFPESALHDEQFGHESFSAVLQPELFYEWDGGYQRAVFTPFFRWDQHDEERTHWDVRELYWEMIQDDYELRFGARQVFWGVAESQHLVDIINQTDQIESIDGEDKLGQPMLQLTLVQDWGTLNGFLMSGFRERNFAGGEGRLRAPLPVLMDRAVYESSAEEWHLDWALRWSHYFDVFDVGISHFNGTSREPLLQLGADEAGNPVLTPLYPLINQTGLDVQATVGGWLFKLEAITRGGQGERYYAGVGGFEYTFGDVGRSGIDIGVLAEYGYDDRGDEATQPFDDDIFVGSRLAFNDVQSTDLLAGVFVDRDSGAGAARLEGSRRLGSTFKLSVELNAYFNAPADDPLYGLRRDSYLQVELARYF